MFVKTIPNDTLDKNVVPEPADYIEWQPSERAARLGEDARRS